MNPVLWLINVWRYYVTGWNYIHHQCPSLKYVSRHAAVACQRCKHHPGQCKFGQ